MRMDPGMRKAQTTNEGDVGMGKDSRIIENQE